MVLAAGQTTVRSPMIHYAERTGVPAPGPVTWILALPQVRITGALRNAVFTRGG
jgi:hypothetical protein